MALRHTSRRRYIQRSQPGAAETKLHYYAETDSLYIELKAGVGVETREIAWGVNADLDVDGTMIGLDIDGASRKPDLTTLEKVALSLTRTEVAE